MLRICGITYVRTTNYGTCFQAYALQKAIESIVVGEGEHCEHRYVALWRCSDHFSNKQDSFFYRKFLGKFKSFQEEKIKYVDCGQVANLTSLDKDFDAFICGSDVIWNPVFNHQLGLYYLDFTKKYKFSYAASFGKSNIQDSFLQVTGKWIAELSDISVREQSSVEIVRKYSGRDASVIADPVILLNRQMWESIANKTRGKKKYIFSYTTHPTIEYQTFLQKLSTVTGLKVVKSMWIISMKDAISNGLLTNQTPEEWLQLLRDAEYVVTNSFHATVLSTIFNKKFFTVVSGKKDGGSNYRMYDYLKGIGLSDRMFCSVPETIDLSEVDFSESDARIRIMREDGICFLQRNLNEAYNQKQAICRKTDMSPEIKQ